MNALHLANQSFYVYVRGFRDICVFLSWLDVVLILNSSDKFFSNLLTFLSVIGQICTKTN